MSFFGLINITQERRQEIYGNIAEISAPTVAFYVMVALSVTIAAYGLLSNSTAVVIGAMLVAPLMGAIFGIALGVSSGDRKLLLKASIAAVSGVILSITLGILIGFIPLRMDFGSEILARTKPTIYDLIIALASGFAGAYALVNAKVSPALPGVAISTALVPPLATCGLCMAVEKWTLALGAFLLFLANFLAIEIAAAIIFNLFGITEIKIVEKKGLIKFLKYFWPQIIILIFVGIFMTETLVGLISVRRFENQVRTVLNREINSSPGARLSEVYIDRKKDSSVGIMAVILTHYEFTPQQVTSIEDTLRKKVDPGINLIIRSLLSKDADRNGAVFISEEDIRQQKDQMIRKEEEEKKQEKAQEETKFIQDLASIINKNLEKMSGTQIVDILRGEKGDELFVLVTVQTPVAITPELVSVMEKNIEEETGRKIYLVLRSIIAIDSDSEKFVYKKEPTPKPREKTLWEKRLEGALKNQFGQFKGVSLIEYHYVKENDIITVLALVRTPVNIQPDIVKKVETNLRKYITPQLRLVVRSVVGTDSGSGGYIPYLDESKFFSKKAKD